MEDKVLVIRAGQLIDGNGGAALKDAVVVVKGERIAEVGLAAEVRVPPDAEVVDASTRTVLPGLIDAHVHVQSDGAPNYAARLMELQGTWALRAYANVQKSLAMGFTALRSVSSPHYVDIALRDAINQGIVQGPRIRAAGQGLTATGGHMDLRGFAPEVQVDGRTGVCDGPWECRRAAREQIKRGADLIKINACVGSSYNLAVDPSSQEMTYEEMAAICEQAHWYNRRVAAHTSGGSGITDALRAGVDSLEHAHWLTDEQLEMMVKQGAFYVPTLIVNDRGTERVRRENLRQRDWMEKVYVEKWETLARAKKAGVKIAAGTDAGFDLCHGENASEMELLVKGGFTPMEAIVAATRTAADCLDWLKEIGTLEPGKYADVVVVDGDPLADIRILQDGTKIVQVFKGGKQVK
jgi:imidazolonepropionase-like amidohydrolase